MGGGEGKWVRKIAFQDHFHVWKQINTMKFVNVSTILHRIVHSVSYLWQSQWEECLPQVSRKAEIESKLPLGSDSSTCITLVDHPRHGQENVRVRLIFWTLDQWHHNKSAFKIVYNQNSTDFNKPAAALLQMVSKADIWTCSHCLNWLVVKIHLRVVSKLVSNCFKVAVANTTGARCFDTLPKTLRRASCLVTAYCITILEQPVWDRKMMRLTYDTPL